MLVLSDEAHTVGDIPILSLLAAPITRTASKWLNFFVGPHKTYIAKTTQKQVNVYANTKRHNFIGKNP